MALQRRFEGFSQKEDELEEAIRAADREFAAGRTPSPRALGRVVTLLIVCAVMAFVAYSWILAPFVRHMHH
jgi:hypothetical protein